MILDVRGDRQALSQRTADYRNWVEAYAQCSQHLLRRQLFKISDFEEMEEIRARVDAIVKDGETAQKLKAWYRQLCKRPCFHDEYWRLSIRRACA